MRVQRNSFSEPDEATLRKQIGYLKEMGFGGFYMHSRVGMASEYPGEEFMHMVSSCVDEAKNAICLHVRNKIIPQGVQGLNLT